MAINCSNCGAVVEGAVPKADLDALAEKLTAAEARVTELEAEVAAAAAATEKVAELEGKVAELEGQVVSEQIEKTMIIAGLIDPEGQEICRMCWDMLPEDKRPASLSEWLADKDNLPKAVLAYMPADEAGAVETPAAVETSTTVVRTSTTVVPGGAAPGAGEFTADQIRAMSDEEFAKYEAAILAQIARA